jgi:hypothetical protein
MLAGVHMDLQGAAAQSDSYITVTGIWKLIPNVDQYSIHVLVKDAKTNAGGMLLLLACTLRLEWQACKAHTM